MNNYEITIRQKNQIVSNIGKIFTEKEQEEIKTLLYKKQITALEFMSISAIHSKSIGYDVGFRDGNLHKRIANGMTNFKTLNESFMEISDSIKKSCYEAIDRLISKGATGLVNIDTENINDYVTEKNVCVRWTPQINFDTNEDCKIILNTLPNEGYQEKNIYFEFLEPNDMLRVLSSIEEYEESFDIQQDIKKKWEV